MKYELDLTKQFEEDVERHRKSGNKVVVKKIEELIKELRIHPRKGTGKPEALQGDRKGQWSRRITDKHRLIYKIHENIVTVILVSAWGHYGDK
jgi:toxin YoeB